MTPKKESYILTIYANESMKKKLGFGMLILSEPFLDCVYYS